MIYRSQVTELLLKDPPEIPDERLLRLLATYMWSSGRIAEALACIRLLEQREELTLAKLNLRGYWQLYVGDATSARKTFGRALAQDTKDQRSRLGYAYALFYLQDYSFAAGIFQELADEGGSFRSPPIMAAACRALAVGQNPPEVQIAPLPGLPPEVAEIMEIKLLYGTDTAIEKARSRMAGIESKADRLPLMRLLIDLKLEARQEQEVIELIEDGFKSYPNDGALWLFKGIALRRLSERVSSHECFSKAVEFVPLDPRAWGGFGAGWSELKNFKNAVKAYRIAIFLDESNPNFWGDLGIAEFSQENYLEAMTAISRAIELGMRNFTNYFNLGMCSVYLGESEFAIANWRRAITVEPNHARVEEVRKLIRDAGGPDTDDRFVFGEIDE